MKNYLVIQLARFGDLIQTKRLLATLSARPDTQVHLCLDASLEPLARLVYPDVVLHPIMAHGSGMSGPESAMKILVENRQAFALLAARDFDTVYNLNFSGLNFRLAALFDPDRVKGYGWNNGQEMIGKWPAMAMRWSNYRRLGMNLVDFWGGYCSDMISPEKVNPKARPKGDGIGVVLAGRESRRSLPAPLLAKIIGTTVNMTKADSITLLGSAAERPAGQTVLKEMPASLQSRTKNLAGQTNWQQLVSTVGSLDMLLTPDTGTMHLAAHLGTPVTAFFLSSAWCFETGPYGEGHTVFQARTDCLPCLEVSPCNEGVKCLNGFSDPAFMRFLATGKSEHAPAGILGFHSSFDALGQVYTPFAGDDADAEQRTALRNFIRHHLCGSEQGFSELEHFFAQQLYRDKDWMTPEKPGDIHG
ncbi:MULTISPECIES: glycosyltransferase family 9 protein [unclassified Pseudodesulfovibrio]|uniref:glycosyltransferase family 9 protein n=1 Tax=unclassified Pseudodesulfovibrio TaxID=2661612 RepID=UPI000FEC1069|nr:MULTISPECIES: glycosyltransferase family 9 protein [unclassified Pseudodesulfovibrio]MCJ2163857.1 glycosyltransferase family 9 protein [Pseudodesulfovibrio sp. S3-i]RWU05897.1 ADP-heptose--LPS heptosyltransferase [Pseudodesulfovibrio sp. S3]